MTNLIKSSYRLPEPLLADMNLWAHKLSQSSAKFVCESVAARLEILNGKAHHVTGNLNETIKRFFALKDLKVATKPETIQAAAALAVAPPDSASAEPVDLNEGTHILPLKRDLTDSDAKGYIPEPAWAKVSGWTEAQLKLLTTNLWDRSLSEADCKLKRLLNAIELDELLAVKRFDFDALRAQLADADEVVIQRGLGFRIIRVSEAPAPATTANTAMTSTQALAAAQTSPTRPSGIPGYPRSSAFAIGDDGRVIRGDDEDADDDDPDTAQVEPIDPDDLDAVGAKLEVDQHCQMSRALELLVRDEPIDHFAREIMQMAWDLFAEFSYQEALALEPGNVWMLHNAVEWKNMLHKNTDRRWKDRRIAEAEARENRGGARRSSPSGSGSYYGGSGAYNPPNPNPSQGYYYTLSSGF